MAHRHTAFRIKWCRRCKYQPSNCKASVWVFRAPCGEAFQQKYSTCHLYKICKQVQNQRSWPCHYVEVYLQVWDRGGEGWSGAWLTLLSLFAWIFWWLRVRTTCVWTGCTRSDCRPRSIPRIGRSCFAIFEVHQFHDILMLDAMQCLKLGLEIGEGRFWMGRDIPEICWRGMTLTANLRRSLA